MVTRKPPSKEVIELRLELSMAAIARNDALDDVKYAKSFEEAMSAYIVAMTETKKYHELYERISLT